MTEVFHLKFFLLKKMGKGSVCQVTEVYFYIEMRVIVFF